MQNLTSVQFGLLRELGENPFPSAVLQSAYEVSDLSRVASRLVRQGVLIHLKRDLFILSPVILGHPIEPLAVANRICSPSYVSREAALSYWGLIPELVVNVTNSRLGRTTEFTTSLGVFHYERVDSGIYAIGLCEASVGKSRFLCAKPEKALYDLILARKKLNIRSRLEMRRFLFEDLRLDIDGHEFDDGIFDELIASGRKRRMVEIMKEELCHG